jgi:hypothetical protein
MTVLEVCEEEYQRLAKEHGADVAFRQVAVALRETFNEQPHGDYDSGTSELVGGRAKGLLRQARNHFLAERNME